MSFYWPFKVFGCWAEWVRILWWFQPHFPSSGWTSSCDKGVMVSPGMHSKTTELPDLTTGMENEKTLRQFPVYGAVNGNPAGDTCPTCRGTGRIPRGWFFFFVSWREKSVFSTVHFHDFDKQLQGPQRQQIETVLHHCSTTNNYFTSSNLGNWVCATEICV